MVAWPGNLQALHRVRERLVSQRTGIINQIRGLPETVTRCGRAALLRAGAIGYDVHSSLNAAITSFIGLTGQRIHKLLDAILCRGADNDVSLSGDFAVTLMKDAN